MSSSDSSDLDSYNRQRAAWQKKRRAMKHREIAEDYQKAQNFEKEAAKD